MGGQWFSLVLGGGGRWVRIKGILISCQTSGRIELNFWFASVGVRNHCLSSANSTLGGILRAGLPSECLARSGSFPIR